MITLSEPVLMVIVALAVAVGLFVGKVVWK